MADETEEKKTTYSFEEYKEKYFPIASERKRRQPETPEELGRRLADESIEKAFREVSQKQRA